MAIFGDEERTFLGDCSGCGRALVQAGRWGNPGVAIVHCSGCGTYEGSCKCEEAVLVLTASEVRQVEAALNAPPHVIEQLVEALRRQR